jgi:predicted nucleotidyltransferase
MVKHDDILLFIKSRVLDIVPGASVSLFGSRAYGNPTPESDWDILVLTDQPVEPSVKKDIHSALFPLSVELSAFINTLVLEKNDWNNNPAYYSLHQTVDGRMINA